MYSLPHFFAISGRAAFPDPLDHGNPKFGLPLAPGPITALAHCGIYAQSLSSLSRAFYIDKH